MRGPMTNNKKTYDACKRYWTWVRPCGSFVFEISNQVLRSGLLPCLFLVLQNQWILAGCVILQPCISMWRHVCLHMLKLSTKRRPRAIWNVICKWQCMPLLSLLQLLDLNSIDYNFARMMIWLGICKLSRVFFFPCYHGFNVLPIFFCKVFNFFNVLWNQSIGEWSISKLFSYIKCHHDSDIAKGQCCNDKTSEEG